jgi:hypothetical protein
VVFNLSLVILNAAKNQHPLVILSEAKNLPLPSCFAGRDSNVFTGYLTEPSHPRLKSRKNSNFPYFFGQESLDGPLKDRLSARPERDVSHWVKDFSTLNAQCSTLTLFSLSAQAKNLRCFSVDSA